MAEDTRTDDTTGRMVEVSVEPQETARLRQLMREHGKPEYELEQTDKRVWTFYIYTDRETALRIDEALSDFDTARWDVH